MCCGKRGFTLLEMSIVISLTGFFFLLSIVCYDGVRKRMTLKGGVRLITGTMRYAGYLARSEGRAYRVKLKDSRLYLEKRSGIGWELVKSTKLSWQIESNSKGAPVFWPEGYVVPAGSFTLSIDKGGLWFKVTVSATGRIKICNRVS